VTDAIALMQKYHLRSVVISVKTGKLCGVITQSDLLLQVHKVKTELEEMNSHLRNTAKSLKRYSDVGTENARVKSLKKKVNKLEKSLERTQKILDKEKNLAS